MQVRQLLRNGQTEAGGIVLGVGGGVKIAVKHGGMPQPVSVTFTRACPFSAAHTTVTRPPEGV